MASSRNTFDVKDEECLVWIKDPSVSPFINKRKTYGHVIKREIYNEELQGNPKSILNNIKRRCFYNSALRQKIVDKIKEFHRKGTLRLYPVELGFTYSNPPFTVQECEAWAKKHLINPRTRRPIKSVHTPIYMELFYTTLQYRLEPPKEVFEIAETDIFINDVKKRLALIEEIDNYFLNEPIPKETFDLSNNVRKKHSFSVSTSSNKSLSPTKKRILTDRMLEEAEKHRLVVEHHHSKHSQRQITEQTHNANLFQSLSAFLVSLSNELKTKRLITYIFKSFETKEDKAAVIKAIQQYFEDYTVSPEEKGKVFDGIMIKSKDQNIILKKIIEDYIRNIYSQIQEPIIIPKTYIEYLSYWSFKSHLNRTGLRLRISKFLLKFIDEYNPALDKRIKEYLKNLIMDTISVRDIAKLPLELDTREEISEGKGKDEKTYINDYYTLLYYHYDKLVKKEGMRLPKGMGFITNMKVYAVGFSVDDNPQNNFTYKECEMWVQMPIFNPRTFAPIKIDSPIYYRLLCISYQYDTHLIPRMITTKGTEVLIALNETIQKILDSSGKPPQQMKDLEDYIQKTSKFDVKFKIIGTTQPKDGTEIINEKMKMAFIKMASPQNGKMPFYVYFTKEDLKEFGITTELAEKSYIKIEEYYYMLVASDAERKKKKEVINKPIALPERLDYNYYEIKYRNDECVYWAQVPNINPRTNERIKQDSDEYNDIFIQALHFDTNIRPYNISPKGIKFRRSVLKTIPTYYDIGDCLKWIRQPKENPKTGEEITRDSPKYNEIFERALQYDSNIEPNDISRAGKIFKRLVLKRKEEIFGYEKVSRRSKHKGECKDINEINSVVCDLVKNIYDGKKDAADGSDTADATEHKKLKDGGNYIKLKDRMIGRCQEYNTPPEVSMSLIDASIKIKYPVVDDEYIADIFDFYKSSAIASVVIYFFNIKNQLLNENQSIFSINYTTFYMSILNIYVIEKDGEKIYTVERSPAADGGGPTREFLTTFFEELFCDDEHPKRPFIKPQDNIEDRYYINPNFEPDDNFKTVIEAYNSINSDKLNRKFNTEKDYLYIYEIIGRVLTSAVVNEDIGLPQQLSRYILAGLMKQPKDITESDLLYFYVSEFDGATMYLSMINKSQFNFIEDTGLTFNDNYVISKKDYEISKENCVKFVLQLAKHIITKNFLHKDEPNSHKNMKLRYDSLFAGFGNKTRVFLADIKITIDQLNQLITNVKFDDKYLKEFADKIKITIEGEHTLKSKKATAKLRGMQQYITNIITNRKINGMNGEKRDTDEAHHLFIRRLLRFWTAIPSYNKNTNYTIYYKYGKDKQGKAYDTTYLPKSQTCFNQLEIYGYPDSINKPQDIEDYIYNKLKQAVENTPGMDNR